MPEKHMITENGLMTRIVAHNTGTTDVTFYQCIESEEVWIPMGMLITAEYHDDDDETLVYAFSDYVIEFLYDDRLTGRAGAHGQQRKEVFVETSFHVFDLIDDTIMLNGSCSFRGDA